jgi:hypothetical protein
MEVNENVDRRHCNATRRGLGSRLRSRYELEASFHRLRSYEEAVFKDGRKKVYSMRQNNDEGEEQAGRAPFRAFRPHHRHSLSPTDMHRALLLPEIVTEIVEELSDLDLYTLARTCQAFTEPALDVLWRDPTAGNAVLAERMAPELWTIEPLEFTPDNDIWDPNDIRNWQNMVVSSLCAYYLRRSTDPFVLPGL